MTIQPYKWNGTYAQWRSNAPHDAGLCADVRGGWLKSDERIILRACEIVGTPDSFFYDDHFPPSEASGRGKDYRHVPFTWEPSASSHQLSADCPVPGLGSFGLKLSAGSDCIELLFKIKNSSPRPVGPIDWAFCVVTLECGSIRDPKHDRTFIFDGERLRTFSELKLDGNTTLIPIAGGNEFVPRGHEILPRSSVIARASTVITEAPDKKHAIALGFEQSYNSYGCTGNMCIHADPFFGTLAPGEEKQLRGKLYFVRGNAMDALGRYLADFKS
jgi:hypothetical protein